MRGQNPHAAWSEPVFVWHQQRAGDAGQAEGDVGKASFSAILDAIEHDSDDADRLQRSFQLVNLATLLVSSGDHTTFDGLVLLFFEERVRFEDFLDFFSRVRSAGLMGSSVSRQWS